MGSTYFCQQILRPENSAMPIDEALRVILSQQGYMPAENAADADCTLYLVQSPQSPWLAVIDTDTCNEGLYLKGIRRRTQALAWRTRCTTVGLELCDSDALVMLLDEMSPEGLVEEDVLVRDGGGLCRDMLGYNPRTAKGRAEIWARACGLSPEQTAEMQAIWDKDYACSEEQLYDLAPIVGFEPGTLNLLDYEIEEMLAESCEGCTITKHHFINLKNHQRAYEIVTEGDALLTYNMWHQHMILGQSCFQEFHNEGGPAKGVQFQLYSEAFAAHPFTFPEAAIEKFPPDADPRSMYAKPRETQSAPFELKHTPDGTPVMAATFPEFTLPTGVRVSYMPEKGHRKLDDLRRVHSVIVRWQVDCTPEVAERVAGTPVAIALVPFQGKLEKVVPSVFYTQEQFDREMEAHRPKLPNVDDFIAAQPEELQPMLQQVCEAVRAALPQGAFFEYYGSNSIRYHVFGGTPLHFSAAKKHLGFFPGETALSRFAERLAGYRITKTGVQFPYDKEIPYALIGEIAKWCAGERL